MKRIQPPKSATAPHLERLRAKRACWNPCAFLTLVLCHASYNSPPALAQNPASKSTEAKSAFGKIGRGKRDVTKKTCILPVKTRGMSEGDLAEVLDVDKNRVAVVHLVRLARPTGRLAAQVIVGEQNCSSLSGYTIRPLSSLTGAGTQLTESAANPIVAVAAQFMVVQSALPGLALNKFLSPGYTQRGFGVKASGTFPRQPIKLGNFQIQGTMTGHFSSSVTTPAIDIIKDGKVLGTQVFSTTTIQARAGARALTADSRLWTEAGVIVFDSISTKSTLAKSSEETDTLFAVIREFSGQGFGLYAEQGLLVGTNTRLSLWGGVGLGKKYTTPIVEDAESTNTTENFITQGLPFSAGASINIPVWQGLYSEVNFDFSSVKLALPLINEQESKSQIERLSFSVGAGYRL